MSPFLWSVWYKVKLDLFLLCGWIEFWVCFFFFWLKICRFIYPHSYILLFWSKICPFHQNSSQIIVLVFRENLIGWFLLLEFHPLWFTKNSVKLIDILILIDNIVNNTVSWEDYWLQTYISLCLSVLHSLHYTNNSFNL